MKSVLGIVAIALALLLFVFWRSPKTESSAGTDPLAWFQDLLSNDRSIQLAALEKIEANWTPSTAVMLVETTRAWRGKGPSAMIFGALSRQTGQEFAYDTEGWMRWIWKQKQTLPPEYMTFKSNVYSKIDSRFAEYFSDDLPAKIRMDEVRWGGVSRDSIPLLDHPKTIAADEAGWLDNGDIVFGVAVNGKYRCYPKRILAWHELVRDKVGDQEIAGVYCTLCGSMVVYDPNVQGVRYELGTSGFLYRSNKLMYDSKTKSLWSTLTGQPVVGPLVDQGIQLNNLPVVTTTWGKWSKLHPDTDVLSLETGHQRDYGEGIAYQEYFATDEIMFAVPNLDQRLANKQPVLVMRDVSNSDQQTPLRSPTDSDQQAPLRSPTDSAQQLAIDRTFLDQHPVFHEKLGSKNFVVLTDAASGSRAYWSEDVQLKEIHSDGTIVDDAGSLWNQTETELVGPSNRRLRRAATHEAFWFGWVSQFPETRLIRSESE
ncbi:MAG: DUF3179 domain-containing protein [Fuerstiella sp.]